MYSRSPDEVMSLTLTYIPSTVLLLFNFCIIASLIPRMAVQFLYLLANFPPEIAPMYIYSYQSRKVSFSPVFIIQFSHSVMFDSLWPHESQHARPPCPSPTPGVHSNSCPSSQWCHSTISFSAVPFLITS